MHIQIFKIFHRNRRPGQKFLGINILIKCSTTDILDEVSTQRLGSYTEYHNGTLIVP